MPAAGGVGSSSAPREPRVPSPCPLAGRGHDSAAGLPQIGMQASDHRADAVLLSALVRCRRADDPLVAEEIAAAIRKDSRNQSAAQFVRRPVPCARFRRPGCRR
jgi:hypothetical protein